jgi:hypothetical protein
VLDGGAVAQDGTRGAPDSPEPNVTDVMIAGGISQLHNVDGDLAELKATVTAVYRVMRQLRGLAHELLRQAAQTLAQAGLRERTPAMMLGASCRCTVASQRAAAVAELKFPHDMPLRPSV